MDKGCNLNKDCPSAGLTAQTPDKYSACTIKQQAPEPVDGCKSHPAVSVLFCYVMFFGVRVENGAVR